MVNIKLRLAHFHWGLLFLYVRVLLAIERTPDEIGKILKENGIVPDIIELSPKHELKIKYVYGYSVFFGNILNPNFLEGPPFLVRFPREKDEYFTLLMVDPDQPSRSSPKEQEWVHWLVTNMDGCSVLSGDTIVKYLTPKPSKNTGLHRYIYFIFKQEGGPRKFQNEKFINDTSYDPKIRGHFSTKDFMRRNNFEKPYAVNFFQGEWKPPQNGSTTIPPEFDFTYQTIDADILKDDIDYDATPANKTDSSAKK